MFRSLDTFRPGTFEGWLHRITTNLFLDQARRRRRIRFESLPDNAGDRLPGSMPAPDLSFADQIFDDDIEVALRELKPEFRVAVVLCDVEGLSYEEISEVLQLKIGTVRSRIHRGRSLLAHRASASRADLDAQPLWRCAGREPGGRSPVSHLHHKVSALIDGELSPHARSRALPMPAPARSAAGDRETLEVKRRVTKLAPVEVSDDLLEVVVVDHSPAAAAPAPTSRPARLRRVVVGAGSMSAVVIVLAYVVGRGSRGKPGEAPYPCRSRGVRGRVRRQHRTAPLCRPGGRGSPETGGDVGPRGPRPPTPAGHLRRDREAGRGAAAPRRGDRPGDDPEPFICCAWP